MFFFPLTPESGKEGLAIGCITDHDEAWRHPVRGLPNYVSYQTFFGIKSASPIQITL